ncbi:hypothetical protein D3C87_2054370 [compost metagenome]
MIAVAPNQRIIKGYCKNTSYVTTYQNFILTVFGNFGLYQLATKTLPMLIKNFLLMGNSQIVKIENDVDIS